MAFANAFDSAHIKEKELKIIFEDFFFQLLLFIELFWLFNKINHDVQESSFDWFADNQNVMYKTIRQ